MNRKLIGLLAIFSIIFIPSSSARAFEYVDNVNNGISTYFLTYLNASEYIEVNVTHVNTGNFTLFLFDSRPIKSHVTPDLKLEAEIFDLAIVYDLSDNPYINFTTSKSGIYYIQIILINNGPDTFFLYCNVPLTRYYLPIISSYSILQLLGLILLTSIIIIILAKKKVKFNMGI